MNRDKGRFLKKQGGSSFKRKGNSRKGRGSSSISSSRRERPLADGDVDETVYRILCPSRKIGSVIGKGGSIVNALREETHAKISIGDSVPYCDERVIMVYSSREKVSKRENDSNNSGEEDEDESAGPHCAAQDALLKIHDRIVKEEDRYGGVASDDDDESEGNVVTARLLVPSNMVGCLLGKGGDVIQRLRSETGANIRVFSSEHLPACALSTDELVQISGKEDVTKRALFDVSTLLHQNPRPKDKSFKTPAFHGGRGFHPPAGPENPMWPVRNSANSVPPMPWDFRNQTSGFGPGGFDGIPSEHGKSVAMFSMKMLCSEAKIGAVFGKGGANVRMLEQESGASIDINDFSPESDYRVIRISAFEGMRTSRSQTIDAVLQLQNLTSDYTDKGSITTRLLVQSNKVGCILGEGGHVINEMRRRLKTDIRVFPREEKPKCASEDEELVQISGHFTAAKDALVEIASRLRVRSLRDTKSYREEPAKPVGPLHGFGNLRSVSGAGPLPSGMMSANNFGGYEPHRGGELFLKPHSFPVPTATTGFPNTNGAYKMEVSHNGLDSVMGMRGSHISNPGEIVVMRGKPQDHPLGGSIYEPWAARESSTARTFMSATAYNVDARQATYQANMTDPHRTAQSHMSATEYNVDAHQTTYQANMADPHTATQNYMSATEHNVDAHHTPYQANMPESNSAHQSVNAQYNEYHSLNSQPRVYLNTSVQQNPQQNMNVRQTAVYQQSAYPEASTYQAVYAEVNDSSAAYPNISMQQSSYQQ